MSSLKPVGIKGAYKVLVNLYAYFDLHFRQCFYGSGDVRFVDDETPNSGVDVRLIRVSHRTWSSLCTCHRSLDPRQLGRVCRDRQFASSTLGLLPFTQPRMAAQLKLPKTHENPAYPSVYNYARSRLGGVLRGSRTLAQNYGQ